jgi:hypothetical protein
MLTLNLELVEIQHLLNLLGNLPTHTGAFPLAVKIKEQAEAQLPQEETSKEE